MKLALLLTPFRLSLAVAVAIWATVVAIVAWCPLRPPGRSWC